ncbi:MAG: HAD family hydrolase [Anaerolineae bacterium]
MIEVIAFDADDTLWQSESLYFQAQREFQALLAPYVGDNGVVDTLYETEMGNLPYYGYGIKSFALSMIETAIRLTDAKIDVRDIQRIVDLAKEMLGAPVRLLDQVEEVIPVLSDSYPLLIITKGDLIDQEAKVARSGLAPYFSAVEVVSDKTPDVYRTVLAKHQIDPGRFLMVGNSLRSDILPVVSLGAQAVHIPYHITWEHEKVPEAAGQAAEFLEIEHIGLLLELVARLEQGVQPESQPQRT